MKIPAWAQFLVFVAILGICGMGFGLWARVHYPAEDGKILILKELPTNCVPNTVVAVQDASETKAAAEGRLTLYKCRAKWEVQ
jgi:hypothetical protein